jgi:ComF family protein
MLESLFDPLLSIVYPQKCLSCDGMVDRSADGAACDKCWEATRIFDGDERLCRKCGAVASRDALPDEFECGQCSESYFDSAAAAGIYEFALSSTVIALKSNPVLGKRAREALLSLIRRLNIDKDCLVLPVPLSRRRRFERGFNQAEVIADIIARASSLRVDKLNLVRTQHSPIHRVAMDKKARELTVRNSFDVRFPRLIRGSRVLLVDDVFTSGATTSYCAKALKKNGAARVDVVTLARAVM